ncbi:hypothetical protein FNV43_RR10427 [Rhamnella rubrinervis]|uniref:snRNA-activating protein complex subunit 1 n=1 Tax=Rhamnella rubrinervis TaxID=2594499 RepID=A0A8K0HC70_9ROSA|nr:hypothetical protein FNV43_RR10427 [Rhamnella rubrinervis]
MMDVCPFKQDIDELMDEFAQAESTTLADMKRVWLSRKMSYIYEVSPSSNLGLFMQSLYGHSIGYMISTASLSYRLGGLYCLYCLYETQPFKPPFKIYLSLEEMKKLKNLVVVAKEHGLKVASALVKRMLDKNMFLFGFVDITEGSIAETVNQLTELQNARIQYAHKELFRNTRIEEFLHMDMDMEVGFDMLKKLSTEYAKTKKLAINDGDEKVDVQDIKHIAEDDKMVGDAAERIIEEWNVQKQLFYQQTGLNQQLPAREEQQEQQLGLQDDDESFDKELEQLLSQTDVVEERKFKTYVRRKFRKIN